MTAARVSHSRPESAAPAVAPGDAVTVRSGPGSTVTAIAAAPTAARAACTMRMAPRREPPYDDELPARHLSLIRTSVAPELPFPGPGSAGPGSAAPRPRRRLSLVPDLAPATDCSGATTPSAPTEDRRAWPDPSRFGRQFAQGVVEVLSGRRPMVQLTRHVSPAVQRGLTRAGAGHQLRSDVAPVIHSVHLSEPAEGVCEMSAIVVVGPRYRALAARLEWRSDRWRCTALQVG